MADHNPSKNEVRGIKAVVEALRLEDFPMTGHDVDYAVGDIEIEGRPGETLAVRDVTDQFEEVTFNTPEEVVKAIHLAIDKRGGEQAA